MNSKTTAAAIASFLIFAQILIPLNLSAYADDSWDSRGVIEPIKKTEIKALHQAKAKEHQSIPIYRHKTLAIAENTPRQYTLANTTNSQNFTLNGVIEGLSYDDVTPPDVQIAAGPTKIMEMDNLQGQVWTKDGKTTTPFELADFFGTGFDHISDPKIFYDDSSGRWFASITDVTKDIVRVAVSDSSDPTSGVFCLYDIKSTEFFLLPDQPIIGISNDKFVVSVNSFNFFSGQFRYAQFWVINKSDLVNCQPSHFVTKTLDNYFSVHPAFSLTDANTIYMASTQMGPDSAVNVFSVNGLPPNPVSLMTNSFKVTPIVNPPSAGQKGSEILLDTGDNRILDAVWANNNLWLAFANACIPLNDTDVRSCMHFTKINTKRMTLGQDFDYGIKGKHILYPALTQLPLTGSLLVVFGVSSADDYPGLMITKQASADPPATLEKPLVLQEGIGPVTLRYGCYTSCRYGDYFGAAIDPVIPNGVWAAGEYGSGVNDTLGLGMGWGTKIGNLTG